MPLQSEQLPPYVTDLRSRLHLDLAASTVWNQQALAAPYYSCYVNPLHVSLSAVSNRFHVATRIPLPTPGLGRKAPDSQLTGQGLEQAQERISTNAEQPESEGERRSNRIQETSEAQVEELAGAREAAVKAWSSEQQNRDDTGMFFHTLAASWSNLNIEASTEEGDDSLGNAPGPDNETKDPTPDLLVHHVIAGEIDKPTMEHVKQYYPDLKDPQLQRKQLEFLQHQHMIRSGIQILHRRCVLIGEIKALSIPQALRDCVDHPVFENEHSSLSAWTKTLSLQFSHALEQALFYCAVHFFTQDEQDKVIILPAVGPYWSWGWVYRNQTPEYDWISGAVKDTPEDQKKAAALKESFSWESKWESGHIYTLGSQGSDQGFTAIRDEILSNFGSIPDPATLPEKYNFRILKDEPLFCPPH